MLSVRLIVTYCPSEIDCSILAALLIDFAEAKRSCEHLKVILQTLTASWPLRSVRDLRDRLPENFDNSLERYAKPNHDFRSLIS